MLVDVVKSSLEKALGGDWQDKRLLVAVSGGCDSMVLGHCLAEIYPAHSLVVAHVNYQLRGEDSDGDEALVRATFQKKGIEVVTCRLSGGNSEEALRDMRRSFFLELLDTKKLDFVATAHHANDQLETFLMRLTRGTGLDGLSSMVPKRGKFLKPLLGVSRADLEAFASLRTIPYRHDSSNDTRRYFRNRVRHLVVPALSEVSEAFGGQKALLEKVAELTTELAVTAKFLEELSSQWRAQHVVVSPFWSRFPLLEWRKLKAPLSEQVLRDHLKTLGSPTPSRKSLSAFTDWLSCDKKGTELEGATRVRQSCGLVYFQTKEQRALAKRPLRFEQNKTSFVCDALGLTFRIDDPHLADAEMRFFSPGDRYQHTKLKKLLLTHRVPAPERPWIPVLAERTSHELLWYFPLSSDGVKAERLEFPFYIGR